MRVSLAWVVLVLVTGCPRLVVDLTPREPASRAADAGPPPLPVVQSVCVQASRPDGGMNNLLAYALDEVVVTGQNLDAVAGVVQLGTLSLDLLPSGGADGGRCSSDGGSTTTMRARLPATAQSGRIRVVTRIGPSTESAATVNVIGPGHPERPADTGPLEPTVTMVAAGMAPSLCGAKYNDTESSAQVTLQGCREFNAAGAPLAAGFVLGGLNTPAERVFVTAFDLVDGVPSITELPAASGTRYLVAVSPVHRAARQTSLLGPVDRPVEPAALEIIESGNNSTTRLSVGGDVLPTTGFVTGFAPFSDTALATVSVEQAGGDHALRTVPMVVTDAGVSSYQVVLGGTPKALARLGPGQDVVLDQTANASELLDLACESHLDADGGAVIDGLLIHRVVQGDGGFAANTVRRAVAQGWCGRQPLEDGGFLDPTVQEDLERANRCVATAGCDGDQNRCILTLLNGLLPVRANDLEAVKACADAAWAMPACRAPMIRAAFDCPALPDGGAASTCQLPQVCLPGSQIDAALCRDVVDCALDPQCNADAMCQLDQKKAGGARCEDSACIHQLCDGNVSRGSFTRSLQTLATWLLLVTPQAGESPCQFNTYSQRLTPVGTSEATALATMAVPDRPQGYRRVAALPAPEGTNAVPRQILVFDPQTSERRLTVTPQVYSNLLADPLVPVLAAIPQTGGRVDVFGDNATAIFGISLFSTPIALAAAPAQDGRTLAITNNAVMLLSVSGTPEHFMPTPPYVAGLPFAAESASPWDMPVALWLPLFDDTNVTTIPTITRMELTDQPCPSGADLEVVDGCFGARRTLRMTETQGAEAVYAVPVTLAGGHVLAFEFADILDGPAEDIRQRWLSVPAVVPDPPAGEIEPRELFGTADWFPVGVHPQTGRVVFLNSTEFAKSAAPCQNLLRVVKLGDEVETPVSCPLGADVVPFSLTPSPDGALVGFFVDRERDVITLGQILPNGLYAPLVARAADAPAVGSLLVSPDARRLYVGTTDAVTELVLEEKPEGLRARIERRSPVDGTPEVMAMDIHGTRLLFADRERQRIRELR